MNETKEEQIKLWMFIGLGAGLIIGALLFVLSGSKKTVDADDLRGKVDKVAFVKPVLGSKGSVYCPVDHTHGFPVCSTCKKIMQPIGNGLYVCPECGKVGIPTCPKCGGLMEADKPEVAGP